MPIYQIAEGRLRPVNDTKFKSEGLLERKHLQQLVKRDVSLILPGVKVIAEEFSDWNDSKRRIDLLGVDQEGNLVVIELKRGESGGFMDLQAIRYAAMISQMKFEQAVQALAKENSCSNDEAENDLFGHLSWDKVEENDFAKSVRIVLISADFGTELISSVLWLTEQWGMDITCIRLQPRKLDKRILLDIQVIVPLPEANDYKIRIQQKVTAKKIADQQERSWTGFWHVNCGDDGTNDRAWEDARKYGYLPAGGGELWRKQIKKLATGDLVLAYLSGHGYVGVGRVTAEAIRMDRFFPEGSQKPLTDLPLIKPQNRKALALTDWCAAVEWISTKDRTKAIRQTPLRQTVGRIFKNETVEAVLDGFGMPADSLKKST